MSAYDAIIVGTGQSGPTLASKLVAKDWSVAVVEGGRFGGTCVNYGCSPTKVLVASARAAHMARRGPDFGVVTGDVSIDFDKVMARQNDLRNSWNKGIEGWMDGTDGIDVYRGWAAFTGPNELRVNDDSLTGERIYLNVGARAREPEIPGLDAVEWLDNRRLLDLKDLPEHLIVIGGSYIGLEFGQIFRRLGSQVTVIERGTQLMLREDEDIAEAAKGILENEGMRVVLNADVKRVNSGIEVVVEIDGKEETVTGSHLLVSVGRVPNSDKLNLAAAGIDTDDRGYILVDDHLKTGLDHVWAMGDVNGKGAFTHTSFNDYEIVWDNINGGNRKVSDRYVTYNMYIDPPLGRVGMSEKDVRQAGRKALMGVKQMSEVSRAIERDETQGLIKVLVDPETDRFLGATILGIGGDELISTFAALMYADAPCTVLRDSVLPHPTVAELLPFILDGMEMIE